MRKTLIAETLDKGLEKIDLMRRRIDRLIALILKVTYQEATAEHPRHFIGKNGWWSVEQRRVGVVTYMAITYRICRIMDAAECPSSGAGPNSFEWIYSSEPTDNIRLQDQDVQKIHADLDHLVKGVVAMFPSVEQRLEHIFKAARARVS